MNLENYQPLETPVTISRTDIGIIARLNEAGQPVQQFEILMARKDKIVVRPVGARKASAPVKIEMPAAWDKDGHEIEGQKYQFMKKSGVEIAPKSGKIKKVGKKLDGPTKLDLCRAIWKASPDLPRKDMIAKFVSDAKCTQQGANTYYLLVQKEQ